VNARLRILGPASPMSGELSAFGLDGTECAGSDLLSPFLG
jgi:hypothetical protein